MKLVQPSFTGGEISPSLYARTDLQRYANSLKTCRNMIVSAYGGCYNRPGTRYVSATKDSGSRKSRLIPFQFNTEQTYVIELGHLYARFYANGAQVVTGGGSPVQVTTPYTEDDIWDVRFTQSADVLQLVHRNHPPQTLKRLSASSFSFGEYIVYEGPFQPVNPNQAVKIAASASTGKVTLTSNTSGTFTSDMVGTLLYLENANLSAYRPWTSGEKGVSVGTIRRNAGKTYRAAQIAAGGTYNLTGGNAPQHDQGSAWDGPGDIRSDGTNNYSVGVLWEYVDSGYGIVKVTGYTSSTVATGLVVKPLPSGVVGSTSPGGTWSLTGDGSTTTFSIAGNTSANPLLYEVTIAGTPVTDDPNRPTVPTGPISDCVAAKSYLPGGLMADQCDGQSIACVDHDTLAVQFDTAQMLGVSLQPCWRLESESGAWVVISKCTKCETRERGYVYGDALEGLSLPVGGDDLDFHWERIVRVTDDGIQPVAKIFAGDRNYPAGGERGRYISTHNMIPAKS